MSLPELLLILQIYGNNPIGCIENCGQVAEYGAGWKGDDERKVSRSSAGSLTCVWKGEHVDLNGQVEPWTAIMG